MAKGTNILSTVRRRWMLEGIVFYVLLSLSVSLTLWILLGRWGYGAPLYGIGIFCLLSLAALLLFRGWKITLVDTARALDRWIPELEESSHLLLRPENDLGALEKLQAARIEGRLDKAQLPHPFRIRLIISIGLVVVAAAPWAIKSISPPDTHTASGLEKATPKKSLLPAIQTVRIRVTPPHIQAGPCEVSRTSTYRRKKELLSTGRYRPTPPWTPCRSSCPTVLKYNYSQPVRSERYGAGPPWRPIPDFISSG